MIAGCQSPAPSPAEIPAASVPDHTLTLIVARLKMHLRDDTYRSHRSMSSGGTHVFERALWRLDRLQSQRDVARDQWGNVDLVIEYARARALERSRRYAEARAAYERVAASGSLLAESAEEAREVTSRFARHSGPPAGPLIEAGEELAFLDGRVTKWRELAREYRRTSWETLALEEAEGWAMVRVEAILRHRGIRAAIESCRRLIERHHASKLYARHLIRLGDLHAEAARREALRQTTDPGTFDAARYETFLDRAFSAYELAGEQRRPVLRAEASKKIEALLAAHRGVRGHVR